LVFHSPGDLRDLDNVRDAVRFAVGVALAGAVVLIAAVVWVSTCQGATADLLACGVPQRTLLGLAAPAVLLVGGLRAFFRWYQSWRRGDASWAWHGAGWFLLALMLLMLTTTPNVAGSPGFG
jgi:hypothetical protein